jgi:hypothetical protein
LGLLTLLHVDKQTTPVLGTALQAQVNTIRSRGFEPTTIYLDPQSAFVPLQGQIPGVEVDIGGAGDHMDKIDAAIKHSKEVMRSVYASLPWKLPKSLVKDLAYYGVSRRNLKRTPSSTVSPRVKFTGRKPVYKKELGLGFGDYAECYDPTCVSRSVNSKRTEPCIALYPTANANGSWWFLNLETKRRVRRTNWDKMVTTELVVAAMNAYAEELSVGVPDEPLFEETGEEPSSDATNVQKETAIISCSSSATVEGQSEHTSEVEDVAEGEDEAEDEQAEYDRNEVLRHATAHVTVARGVRRPVSVQYQAYHTNYRKSLRDHGRPAYLAIVGELKQLLREKKAITPVHRGDLSPRQIKKVIRSIMFLKTKFDGMGVFEKIKARLVANGAMQDKTLYPDNSSPTAMLQSVMMCLVTAASEGRKAVAIDIGGAYLNAERTGEEVIMELEPGLADILKKVAPEVAPYVGDNGKLLVRLDKALYGCLDSAKLWYEKLTSTLRELGYKHNDVDPCVMNKMVNGKQVTLVGR